MNLLDHSLNRFGSRELFESLESVQLGYRNSVGRCVSPLQLLGQKDSAHLCNLKEVYTQLALVIYVLDELSYSCGVWMYVPSYLGGSSPISS